VINTVTSPIAASNSAAEPSARLEQLARRADVNRDGAVVQSEFAGFLSDLMRSLDREVAPPTAKTEAVPTMETVRIDSRDVPAPSPAAAAAALRAAMLGATGDH
jgi:hypothetical protein